MKRILAVVLPLGILAGGLVVLAEQNRRYELKTLDSQTAAAIQDADQEMAMQKLQASLDATMVSNDKLTTECKKGLEAYNQLTAFQRTNTKLTTPSCELAE